MNHRIMISIVIFSLAMLFAGCGDDANDPTEDAQEDGFGQDTGAGSDADAGESTDPELEARLACDEADLVFPPLQGPGFDEAGAPTGDWPSEYRVSSTVIVLRTESEALERFNAVMGGIMAELPTSEGLLGFALTGSDQCGTGRTLTVWRDDAAIMNFVLSEAHSAAMVSTNEVSVWANTTTWSAGADDPAPAWEAAIERLSEAEHYSER